MDISKDAFIDSIEIIKKLDLIITADTSIAHLSATLGKETGFPSIYKRLAMVLR